MDTISPVEMLANRPAFLIHFDNQGHAFTCAFHVLRSDLIDKLRQVQAVERMDRSRHKMISMSAHRINRKATT